jgi:chemotaxis protein methyltransferase CheR
MEITQEGIDTCLTLIQKQYGYDFSGYSRSSFLRRVSRFMALYSIGSISALSELLISNESLFAKFLEEITVNVTEMFRDPLFFASLRTKVIPELKTYPYPRIWDAGCSTGEEAYSLAIILYEEKLAARTRIYATDINQKVISEASEGIYNIADMASYTTNYNKAGGVSAFSDYYHAKYQRAILEDHLKKNIVFSVHNLTTDGSFNEFNLIVCRNVLIYFDRELQEKVLGLFFRSLRIFGFLALGSKESLFLSRYSPFFEEVDRAQKIYRKVKE